MISKTSLPLLPLPNGRAHIQEETLTLPASLGVSCEKWGGLAPEYLAVFAGRAGVALTEDGPPMLRFFRNPVFPFEGYRLRVTAEHGIQIEASTERGICWALLP